MKILNLYAGIGGNRKLWGNDHEITAVEIEPTIAKIYHDFFPNDKVIIADAHQFLLEHFKEFDFIWSSPPCPSHSRMRMLWSSDGKKLKTKITACSFKFPDMKLYEEIIFLTHFCKAKFVVENVISYYKPLVRPFMANNHYFWSNFFIEKAPNECRDIRRNSSKNFRKYGFDLNGHDFPDILKYKLLNNLVKPELGLHVFNMAFKDKQKQLKEVIK